MRQFLPLFILMLSACGWWESDTPKVKALTLIEVFDLDIPEPSGLTLANDSTLYCVSDPPHNRVYVLATDGQLKHTLSYRGDDLEGIAYDPVDSTLWVVEEGLSTLVQLSSSGSELGRWQIDFEPSTSNTGFEGVYRDSERDEIVIVSQNDPPTILRLDANKTIVEQIEVDFAAALTGICRGRNANEYLLISDVDKRLHRWSWSGGLGASYSFDVDQAEGVAYDSLGDVVYLVSDSDSKLYLYAFPNE